MTYRAGIAISIILAGAAAAWLAVPGAAARLSPACAAEKPSSPAAKPAVPPPLVVDKKAPLLLSDEAPGPAAEQAAEKPPADNESCYVCHGNYRDEPLARVHAKANVGCANCHGPSLAHRDDEDNVTAPDIMFAHAVIDKACRACHEEHNVPARKVIARWQQRCPAKTDPGEIVCTDCHGEHRRPFRTVQWDKKTRKVIPRKDASRAAAPPSAKP